MPGVFEPHHLVSALVELRLGNDTAAEEAVQFLEGFFDVSVGGRLDGKRSSIGGLRGRRHALDELADRFEAGQ